MPFEKRLGTYGLRCLQPYLYDDSLPSRGWRVCCRPVGTDGASWGTVWSVIVRQAAKTTAERSSKSAARAKTYAKNIREKLETRARKDKAKVRINAERLRKFPDKVCIRC